MIVLGLTGGIGMGKSTTAQMFRAAGVPVWDADLCVHRLYDGGLAVKPLAEVLPEVIKDGRVSRDALKAAIAQDISVLETVERIVHPLVAADRAAFLAETQSDVVVLDIPLLFETGAAGNVDKVVVVSAPADVQRARVLARGTMTEAQFDMIRARQIPDAEKRAEADYVIETLTLESAQAQVEALLKEVREDA